MRIDQEKISKALIGGGWTEIQLTNGLLSIERRPHYCDRGRYVVKVSSNDPRALFIDEADCFHRYYFGFEAMISEINAWMEARGQFEKS